MSNERNPEDHVTLNNVTMRNDTHKKSMKMYFAAWPAETTLPAGVSHYSKYPEIEISVLESDVHPRVLAGHF
jgi:hypothetical protein